MRPSSTPPVDRYERQLLIERARMNDPAQLEAHQQQEALDVANWHCRKTDGRTPEGQQCDISAETLNAKVKVHGLCAQCANATCATLERREGRVEDVRERARKVGEDLDARASA